MNIYTDYDNLMSRRIRKVLLICSSYDSYTLEEDGRLETQLTEEYLNLNLSNPPSFVRASSAREAEQLLKNDSEFDLILSMFNTGDMDVFEFAKETKKLHPHIPFILLSHFSPEISLRLTKVDISGIDYVFCWMGNTDLILTIIKLLEDKANADDDILKNGVQCILLVEDSIKYYSTYLPLLYKLVLQQSREFVKEALNEQQRMLWQRARPKIFLARTYDEAVQIYRKYSNNLLGIISDVSFKKNDINTENENDGGFELCKLIRSEDPHMPFLLQSSKKENRTKAEELGSGFIYKYSNTLLLELSEYITKELSFGDFIFRNLETGEEVARISNLADMQKAIKEVSKDILLYHTTRNHLSKWMFARGLFSLARCLRRTNSDSFDSTEEERSFILQAISDYRSKLGQGVIAGFDPNTYNDYIWFARMGEGSLGGKARGLAFINSMLQAYKLYDKYDRVRISIPRTVVVATDYFDQFIQENGLKYVINSDADDHDILSEFTGSRLPEKLVTELRAYIQQAKTPIAVRSSSKLEDSHYQPFAGIYSTYMVPYTENKDQMLRMLGKAIKSVYASVYYQSSRSYILATSNVLAEEKMAVILQEVCGTMDNGYYFPTISGVARSLNLYPIEDEKPEEGIVNLAFGLGKLVVDGGQTLRFSPKHPKKVLQLSTPEITLRDTQREMYALNLKPERFRTSTNDAVNLDKIEIAKASEFRNMRYVASTWDRDNQRISDSFITKGRKIITFSNILKYDLFPLADILSRLLEIGRKEMKSQVEIEFAVNMDVPRDSNMIFNFLQIRPIVDENRSEAVNWQEIDADDSLIYSKQALGLGYIDDVCDIVYVKEETFDPANTPRIAKEIEKINRQMREDKRHYVLIGPGRWGSSDPWLGIPVKWSDISEAMVIVESGLSNFRVDPSQGTHFFQNLTSFGVGYMTLNPYINDGIFHKERLQSFIPVEETEYIRHVRSEHPLMIIVDGKNNKGIIR